MLTPLSSRKESDLRRGSSVLLDSKKISKYFLYFSKDTYICIEREGTQVSGLSKGAMSKPKIGGSSTITIDKSKDFNIIVGVIFFIEDLMKSSKGLPGDLLHFK